MTDIPTRPYNGRIRIRLGFAITIIGFLLFILGADPGVFTLDRSPVTGFVQISVFLFGLSIICIGGYITLNSLWNGKQKTIAADIGLRLVATGYVIAFMSGLADIFGLGSQPPPELPEFGPLQAIGVMIGQGVIAVGFLLLIPPWRKR
jgi:hypothetical protein